MNTKTIKEMKERRNHHIHSIKIPSEKSKEYYFTIQNLEISSDNLKPRL